MTTTEPRSGVAEPLIETAAVSLGDVDPARSRHAGRRSAIALVPGADADADAPLAVAGLADGSLVAVAPDGTERWRDTPDTAGSVVTLVTFAGGVLVGERGADGAVRYHDGATGDCRWHHESATDVGDPQRHSRFYLPFVASAATASVDGESRAFVAVRRYERSGDDQPRHFESAVYAFDPDGTIAWQYEAAASPIAVDVRNGRVAVAYNRCPEPDDHDDGLVVLDAANGAERWCWDPGVAMPGPPGQRRVGDVSLTPGGPVVASHADYRGYGLNWHGTVRWQLDLARPVERAVSDSSAADDTREEGADTVYAYPNHVHATESRALFVTGNTYPEAGRETEARHPREHTAVGVQTGVEQWSAPVGGFATDLGAAEAGVAVPSGQHFRDRDAATHALRVFDLADGSSATVETDGIVTCAAVRDGRVAAVEEPVIYHDEGVEHGSYRLRLFER
jgi:hypothetical protein